MYIYIYIIWSFMSQKIKVKYNEGIPPLLIVVCVTVLR